MADDSPRDEALAWWKDHVGREEYVGERGVLPSSRAEQYLVRKGLLAQTPGAWGWVVTAPGPDEPTEVLRRNYWKLVRSALANYEPAAVERVAAVRLHMGEASAPPVLHVVHAASESRRILKVVPSLAIALRPFTSGDRAVLVGASMEMEVDGVSLRVLKPARTLLSLTVTDVRDHRDLVLTWLQSVALSRSELEQAYEQNPRPVLLARIGHLAQAVGNRRFAEQVQHVAAAFQRTSISRSVTGAGRDLIVPVYIASQPSLREPWLDRYRARLARAAEVARQVVIESGLSLDAQPVSFVLAEARSAKADDTYHSTTIEGYRVTREQVRYVLEGMPLDSPDRAEMERLMALKGYSQAFERTLGMIGGSATGGLHVTEADVLDLYEELWGPSVDAEVMSAAQLRGWRKDPVYIRGSDYVPPAPVKVPQLMRVWADTLNAAEMDPVTRAVVAHWGMVHVHPFMDGNGRLSRLVMNLVLCAAGLPWTIIRAEERHDYFTALEQAHVLEEYTAFSRFVVERVRRAMEQEE